jgi:hemerythrin-like domain-containing protein
VVEKKKNRVIRKILFYIVNSINARKFKKSIIYLQKDFDKIFHLNRENKYFNQLVNGLQKFIVDKHNKSLDKGKFNN